MTADPAATAAAAETDLSDSWIQEQLRITAISTKYVEVKELDHGYAYRYPAGWQDRVTVVRDYLRRYYSYFDVDLAVQSDGAVWLHITGPDGTKEWLERGLAYAAGKVKEDGTRHLRPWEKVLKLGVRYATSPLRLLPDFLVIGAAKAGTTSLFSYLAEHPQIERSIRKEVYFFDKSYRRGVGYYRMHFPTRLTRAWRRLRGSQLLTGEATPCYLFDPRVPSRVKRVIPGVKMVVLLRNPIDRAYSFYSMMARRTLEPLGFEEAIEREPERLAGELERMLAEPDYFSAERHHHSYLARGHYAEQLEWWFAEFPRQQFLVLTHEELKHDRQGTVDRVVEFLGLPKLVLPDTGKRNFVPYERMKPETRRRLVEYFAPHNARLQELLGRELDWDR